MKAVRFHAHGGPEVLKYEDAPDPVARPGHVVVRVAACALNHLDLFQRAGLERVTIPMPHISGADVAGTIVLGYQSDGGYAERVAVPAANIIPLPDHIDFIRGKDKCAQAVTLGADDVIDSMREHVPKLVKALTGGHGADISTTRDGRRPEPA